MEELSDELYNAVMNELEKGDKLSEHNHFKTALVHYQKGLDKLPNPKTDWEIALHLYTALGDCYFNLGDYELSNDNYNQALKCPDALGNGYVWLGLGQSYFELDNEEKAKDALMSAYMLEGKVIFEDQDEKYFSLIKPYINEKNVSEQDSELEPMQDDEPYKIYEGKEYTKEEWDKYQEEQRKNRPPGTTWSLLDDED